MIWIGTQLYKMGVKSGIDAYHEMCYTIGGIAIDETGRAVVCKGLVQIPKEELDKLPELVYNT